MKFTNKVYDVLKWIAQYLLPAAGALYFALAKLWQLPYPEEIVGTITAIDAFLGALLGISSHNYQGEGTIQFTGEGLDGESQIELYEDIDDILRHGKITLNVEK